MSAWAVILCRFSDRPTETRPPGWYRGLYIDPTGPIAKYWHDVTNGHIDTTASQIFGWYQMTHATSELAGMSLAWRTRCVSAMGDRNRPKKWGESCAV